MLKTKKGITPIWEENKPIEDVDMARRACKWNPMPLPGADR
jgi:hypothetical protein